MYTIIDDEFMGILNLAIDQKYKRNGVGTQLVYEAANWAMSQKIKYIYLQVEKTNTPAIKLYQKIGFQEWYTYLYYERNFQNSG